MKQIIFLCLLSLTMCYSKPAETQAPASQDPIKLAATSIKPTETSQAAQIPPHVETQSSPKETISEKSLVPTNASITQTTSQASPTENATANLPAATTNKNTTEKNEKTVPTKGNELKKENNTGAPNRETSTDTKPPTNEPKVAANNDSKPVENIDAKNGTSTQTPAKPSDSPKVTPKADDDQHIVQARGFDGPSFMGGIILTLGLLAIGFMGFKYYKNQTERNYHTL